MKLYCTTYIDDEKQLPSGDGEHGAKWAGTQEQQRKDVKFLRSENYRNVQPQVVDVPTDKPGLLEWLNDRRVQP
jgi:hypothetical protein